MVDELLSFTPLSSADSVLDAGSGNKVWFNRIKSENKFECEIERGCDFYQWDKKVDWVIGNPPFDQQKKFLYKATEIARKGVAFLGNINFWNGLTPKRLQKIKDNGFYLQKIHIVTDKRWFGRYYFMIFGKEKKEWISWNTKTF